MSEESQSKNLQPEPSIRSAGISKIRGLLRNPISLIGVALSAVSLVNVFFLFIVDAMSERPNAYVGILAYMIAPGFLIFGLLLILVGVWNQRRRERTRLPSDASRYLRIDFADPAQRGTVAFLLTFILVFVMLSAVGSYRAYEFTDSVQFCGQLCHSVMNPEFTAYQLSPHARVACVDCHVGAGATWYVRSKLSGARQVIATTFHTFPRPIPTPVHNLRPAQETCEQCHWPRKFYGAQLKVFTHYANDEKNTQRQIRMLIKTGGGDPATGSPSGIHWHMNIDNRIDYVATDDRRQVIVYIHVKDLQGRVTEYLAKDSTLTKDQIQKAPKHRMDCVDCHNRPTHIYVAPDQAVDQSLLAHRLDVSLPFLKQTAVMALTNPYKDSAEAMQGIATEVHKFYSSKYPALESSKAMEIRDAITELQRIYGSTTFPEMKLDWKTHNNNVGHFYFAGCFRCHDGQHVSADGKVLPKDCNTCHTVLSQTEGDKSVVSTEGAPFKHPVDLGDITAVNCSDCHTGGSGP
jgi:nitrate/TMAO reductase-like tetraheme cytochrome c subunit